MRTTGFRSKSNRIRFCAAQYNVSIWDQHERFLHLLYQTEGFARRQNVANQTYAIYHYLLYVFKLAFEQFEQRAGQVSAPRGEKADLVLVAIRKQTEDFRLIDIEDSCPGVGRDWIRSILFDIKKKGTVACSGKGRAARWRYQGE